jgi:nicotinate-nucleotide pyrophosphorylase (carboxylating)
MPLHEEASTGQSKIEEVWFPDMDSIIRRALEEDVGAGDLTTRALIQPDVCSMATIEANETLILAGLPVFQRVFQLLAPSCLFHPSFRDGQKVSGGEIIARMEGPATALLMGERVALNFLQHLSGIATTTRSYVDAVQKWGARIVDTRKTTPGLRALQKYAVRKGGGFNHRMGLFDGILIKENHIEACGGVGEAVRRARASVPHTVKVEVEIDRVDQLEEALAAGAEIVLLDNMEVETMRTAVQMNRNRALLEASGGIRLENVARVAATGVDLISVGALTHSSPSVDISMHLSMGE